MDSRPKLGPTPQSQLSKSRENSQKRAEEIAVLNAQNETAYKEGIQRNNRVQLLYQAQEVEQRILVLLNYLTQKPDEEKENLLKMERETQATILKTLEQF